jgi:16S rRNA (cytosine1402-N4)-methyltransferase
MAMGALHQPVLVDDVVSWLLPRAGEPAIVVDGTVGAGGHAAALLARLGAAGRLIGLDRDPAMLALAESTLGDQAPGPAVTLVHEHYSKMSSVLETLSIARVDAVLLDLGLSSDQLAWPLRGFSFTTDAPLDMRFDPDERVPAAADLVNRLPEPELARLFFEFGEERFSRRIARRIVEARRRDPFRTTLPLAELVRRAVPRRPRHTGIDPATRVFQALRIAVNDELGQLESALALIPDILSEGGRAAVISFHSLEDQRVKRAFKSDPRLKALTKKPITAALEELAKNPRARSAKLRVVERCPNPT